MVRKGRSATYLCSAAEVEGNACARDSVLRRQLTTMTNIVARLTVASIGTRCVSCCLDFHSRLHIDGFLKTARYERLFDGCESSAVRQGEVQRRAESYWRLHAWRKWVCRGACDPKERTRDMAKNKLLGSWLEVWCRLLANRVEWPA